MAYKGYRYRAAASLLVPTKGGATLSLTPSTPTPTPDPAGFQLVLDEQFVDNSAGRWNVHDNDYNNGTGSPTLRIQDYMAANTTFGAGASAGATGGTSMRQVVRRDNPRPGQEFSAGMVDSQNAGKLYPLYGRMDFRVKIPHGQGLWPSTWLTCAAANGGAAMSEWDIIEYFHSQVPGKNSSTLHGTPTSTSGTVANRYTNNVGGRTFFEAPTYTPAWHIWTSEILPVTDSTGTTRGDVTQPSQNIRFRVLLDGVEVYKFVDTSALYWSTNGGAIANFWNIYIQGCQVSGRNVGHPDVELGYSDISNTCLIGGTPGSCTKTSGGYTVQRAGAPGATATMGGTAATYEHDYIKIYKAV